jgi:hypothetical protein
MVSFLKCRKAYHFLAQKCFSEKLFFPEINNLNKYSNMKKLIDFCFKYANLYRYKILIISEYIIGIFLQISHLLKNHS